ncbi:MAG: ABC transporter permease [Brevinema sp.]
MQHNRVKKYSRLFFIFIIFLFYLPILTMLIFSFNAGKGTTWEGFSFQWYMDLFSKSGRIWDAFGKSLFVAAISSITSTFIGTVTAWAIWHKTYRLRNFLLTLTYLPLMLPELIIGISLLSFFVIVNIPLGIWAIFIAHTTFTVPFAVILMLSILEDSDLSVLEAARDLGASEFQVWTRVLLPILAPGLIASFVLTTMLSLDDFAITFFVSGPGATTLPVFVYSSIRFGISPPINVLSVLVVGLTFILFTLNRKLGRLFLK